MKLFVLVVRSAAALAAAAPLLASATVAYRLTPEPAAASFQVSIRIPAPGASETFQIPGWSPGYYVMEHYESKISNVKAADEAGHGLPVTKVDGLTWKVASEPHHALVLSYRVAGDDVGLGFFGASVKENEAYTNGPASFMYVLGRRNEAVTVHVDHPSSWKVATAMDAAEGQDNFGASDYDEMADDPIQIGPFAEQQFRVGAIPFRAVFVAPPGEDVHLNVAAQTAILEKVSQPALKLFGGAPFKQYIYFFHLTGKGFQGGLEHRSGTVIAIPNTDDNDLSDLAAHEYFHAWNVKQIRPEPLGPFDYTAPQRTGNLWFAEGVTDYYAKLLTYRSGVHDLGWLLAELNNQIGTYQSGKTRLTSTVEDASRAVWEHGGFSLGDLDYYNKGLLAGLLFDAKIRQVTNGAKNLDDVMRSMYASYRLPQPGYPEDGIKKAINEVAGTDLSGFYDSIIRSTEPLPYSALESIGLKVVPPSAPGQIAVGFPIPTESIDPSDLSRFGISAEDRFIGFAPPAKAEDAAAVFDHKGTMLTVQLPVSSRTFPSWQLLVNPGATKNAMARFMEWTTR